MLDSDNVEISKITCSNKETLKPNECCKNTKFFGNLDVNSTEGKLHNARTFAPSITLISRCKQPSKNVSIVDVHCKKSIPKIIEDVNISFQIFRI